ncbi:hypothetical protein GIB67_008909 [Kingdonia uniflora]|uniref:Uncharacterized protein n=1 Tax=Kingdonia uniflora TaxID=39325 RepID=A0A7J7LVE8_9MAGN|nr:hypothetical protein GIB67_008909 [Kingdonia uniflora]
MALDGENQDQTLITKPISRWGTRGKILMHRRKGAPSIRLGGRKRRHGFFLVMFSRIKVRWLKLQYSCILKKLKKYYYSILKDLIEAGGTFDSMQQRIVMESYFTVPVMGVSTLPSYVSSQAETIRSTTWK